MDDPVGTPYDVLCYYPDLQRRIVRRRVDYPGCLERLFNSKAAAKTLGFSLPAATGDRASFDQEAALHRFGVEDGLRLTGNQADALLEQLKLRKKNNRDICKQIAYAVALGADVSHARQLTKPEAASYISRCLDEIREAIAFCRRHDGRDLELD